MKIHALWKFIFCIFALQLALISVQSVVAVQNDFSEPFNYSYPNNLDGLTAIPAMDGNTRSWSLVSASSHVTIGNSNLTYGGLMDSGGKMASSPNDATTAGYAQFPLATADYTSTEYFSFLLQLTGPAPAAAGQIVLDISKNAAPNTTADTMVIFVKGSGGPAYPYSIGVSGTGMSGAVTYETTAMHNQNDIVLVVIKNDAANKKTWLFINPRSDTFGDALGTNDPTNSQATVVSTSFTSTAGWKSLVLENLNAAGAGAYNIDTFRAAATSYATVVPSTSPPGVPAVNVATNPNPNGFTANWSAGSGTTLGYRLDVSVASNFSSYVAGYNDLDVGSATSSTLTGLSLNTTYYYRVRAYNATGVSVSSTTQAASTTPSCTNPVITSHPTNVTVCTSGLASFTVATSVGSPVYQWQVSTNHVSFSNVTDAGIYSGATTPTLSITSPPANINGNEYRCVVSVFGGCSTASSAATLTVNTAVGISGQPASTSTCSSGSASFMVAASGTGLSYQWQVSADGGNNYNPVSNDSIYSGVTNDTLVIATPPANFNGYKYECVVSGICGNIVSSAATLTMVTTAPPSVSVSANPGTNVCAGVPVVFTATPNHGGNSPSYVWKTNGVPDTSVPGGSATYTNVNLVSGETIDCELTSNDPCRSVDKANAPRLTMVVNQAPGVVLNKPTNTI